MNISYYLANKYTKNGMKYPNLDCWRLVCHWFRLEKGIILNTYPQGTSSNMNELSEKAIKSHDFEEVKEPFDGCIVAIKISGMFSHVGVYTNDKFLHTDYNGTMLIPLERFTNNRKCEVHFFKVV